MLLLIGSYLVAAALVYKRVGSIVRYRRKLSIMMSLMALGYFSAMALALMQLTPVRHSAAGYYYLLMGMSLATCLTSVVQLISFEPPSQKWLKLITEEAKEEEEEV